MGDFLKFETMITPILIQVIFWLTVIFCVVGGIIIMVGADETSARVGGLLLFIFGPIGARIYSEILIIVFRMNDHLRQIEHNTQRP
jgi:hypothetical protein